MPIDMHIWRVDGDSPTQLPASSVPLEKDLEDMLHKQPDMLGETLLVIGRQVPTGRGFIDLLAVDSDGLLNVIELKRDRTPREVTAQILEYGAWVTSLTHDQVKEIYARDMPGTADLDEAYSEVFGAQPPEELNVGHRLTIVAASMDPSTETIINYLSSQYSVPINVLFFRYFSDDGRAYLARSWMRDPSLAESGPSTTAKKSLETWNGRDWYVSFGEGTDGRNWEDARKYGFVSGGHGAWYSRTLRQLPVGARIFTHIPQVGYVGIGEVLSQATPSDRVAVEVNGSLTQLMDLDLLGDYSAADAADEDSKEWVVPIKWFRTVPRHDAAWTKGLFANQNTACKLRNSFTIETVERLLDWNSDSDG